MRGLLLRVHRVRTVVGMLTDRNVCMAAYTQNLPLTHIALDGSQPGKRERRRGDPHPLPAIYTVGVRVVSK